MIRAVGPGRAVAPGCKEPLNDKKLADRNGGHSREESFQSPLNREDT